MAKRAKHRAGTTAGRPKTARTKKTGHRRGRKKGYKHTEATKKRISASVRRSRGEDARITAKPKAAKKSKRRTKRTGIKKVERVASTKRSHRRRSIAPTLAPIPYTASQREHMEHLRRRLDTIRAYENEDRAMARFA